VSRVSGDSGALRDGPGAFSLDGCRETRRGVVPGKTSAVVFVSSEIMVTVRSTANVRLESNTSTPSAKT
jgi:hypothetical protein